MKILQKGFSIISLLIFTFISTIFLVSCGSETPVTESKKVPVTESKKVPVTESKKVPVTESQQAAKDNISEDSTKVSGLCYDYSSASNEYG
jgi:heat shock protein HslJ